jgi:uncharacterized protein YjbJ (UPF0337 family)
MLPQSAAWHGTCAPSAAEGATAHLHDERQDESEDNGMSDRSGARDRAEGTVDEAKGKAKQAWGDLTGDERLKSEGMADEVKGQAKQAWGNVKDTVEDLKRDVEETTR